MEQIIETYMSNLTRTAKGDREIVEKKINLSLKQRQFLLLVNKTDAFNKSICQKLAKKIPMMVFFQHGLLALPFSEEVELSTPKLDKRKKEITLENLPTVTC